jgi:hypothetical protein
LTFCPPGPLARIAWISTSLCRKVMLFDILIMIFQV